MIYHVMITETREYHVMVEADTPDEADRAAWDELEEDDEVSRTSCVDDITDENGQSYRFSTQLSAYTARNREAKP